MTADRRRLANRRAGVSFQFQRYGVNYTATVSFFSDGGMAEIFIDAAKPGSAVAENVSDAAVLVSLLLQHNVTAAAIRHSISGPIATALDIIAERGR